MTDQNPRTPASPAHTPDTTTNKIMATINRPFGTDENTATDLLAASHMTQGHCADLLRTQAHLLDALFKRMLYRDIHAPWKFDDGTSRLDEEKLALALKSQSQCRAALETLRRIERKTDETN